jgi:hypothetical protein
VRKVFLLEEFNGAKSDIKADKARVAPNGEAIFLTECGMVDEVICAYAPRAWKFFYEVTEKTD